MNDFELLRCYAEDRSEAAFAELVKRYIDFVYSAAVSSGPWSFLCGPNRDCI